MTDQLSVRWNMSSVSTVRWPISSPTKVSRGTSRPSPKSVPTVSSDAVLRSSSSTASGPPSAGSKHYLTNLEQITSAVHETAYYGVLARAPWRARTTGQGVEPPVRPSRHAHRRPPAHGPQPLGDLCQKTPRGMFLLDAQLREMLAYKGVEADTWILPSKVGVYMSMVPSGVSSVEEAGPSKAISDNNNPSAAMRKLTTFRGSVVCETRPFDMDFSGEPNEMLRREKMIGEYYTMLSHDSPSSQEYKTDHRSIFIYNCDVDRFEKVQITDAIDNCFRFTDGFRPEVDGRRGDLRHEGVPDGDHEFIKRGYGNSSSREVGNRDDPMMCHHGSDEEFLLKKWKREEPNGVCTWLGDLGLEHFRDSDIRDWAETVKRACFGFTGNPPTPSNCNIFLSTVLPGGMYDRNCIPDGNAQYQEDTRYVPVYPQGRRVFDSPNAIEPLISALQDSWDPSLAHTLLGANHPQMAYVPQLQESQIAQRFHSGFPEMWKSLVKADDFHEVRNSVVGEF